MAKLITSDTTDGTGLSTTVNANNELIENAIENTLSRDGTSPNTMEAQLDMNSNAIVNLPDAIALQSPVTLAQASSISGINVPFTQETISLLLKPDTDRETAAAVTPTAYQWDEYDPRRYGAVHNESKTVLSGTDNSAAFVAANSLGQGTIPVKFTGQVGDVDIDCSINGYMQGVILPVEGAASVFTIDRTLAVGTALDADAGWGDWAHLTFENLYFNMLGNDSGGTYARTVNAFQYPLTPTSTEKTLAGRNVWRNCIISRADKGLYQPTGNFGNYFYNCQFAACNYGVYAVESNTPNIMHPGMLYMNGGEINGSRKAAIYLYNPTENMNGTYLTGISIENNPGHGIYFDGMNLCPDGAVLEAVHFENNDSNGDGTIDLGEGRGSETIRDLMCHDVDYITINRCSITEEGFEFNNSMALLDGCFTNGSSKLQRSTDSVVTMVNANLDGISKAVNARVDSVVQQRRPSGASGVSMRAWIPHRNNVVQDLPGSGVGLYGETFSDDTVNLVAGSGVLTTGGSPLFKNHNRVTTGTSTNYTSGLLTLTQGKWYVYTSCIKLESNSVELIEWENSTTYLASGMAGIINDNLPLNEWHTIGGVAEYDGTTGTCRFRIQTTASSGPFINLGGVQLVQFDTQEEAVKYFNDRSFWQENKYEYNGHGTLSGGTLAIDFTTEGFQDQPDGLYNIQLTSDGSTTTYYSAKSATGFTINGGTTNDVSWNVTRRDP